MKGQAAVTKGGSLLVEVEGVKVGWMNVGEQSKKGGSLECVGGMERRSKGGCGSWW